MNLICIYVCIISILVVFKQTDWNERMMSEATPRSPGLREEKYTHRQEKPLGSTRFKQSLPFLGIFTGEGDGVGSVVKFRTEPYWPRLQLAKNRHGHNTESLIHPCTPKLVFFLSLFAILSRSQKVLWSSDSKR